MANGLTSLVFPTSDVVKSKELFSRVLGADPVFEEPFYVVRGTVIPISGMNRDNCTPQGVYVVACGTSGSADPSSDSIVAGTYLRP